MHGWFYSFCTISNKNQASILKTFVTIWWNRISRDSGHTYRKITWYVSPCRSVGHYWNSNLSAQTFYVSFQNVIWQLNHCFITMKNVIFQLIFFRMRFCKNRFVKNGTTQAISMLLHKEGLNCKWSWGVSKLWIMNFYCFRLLYFSYFLRFCSSYRPSRIFT